MNKLKLLFGSIFIAVFLSAGFANADTLTLRPNADSRVGAFINQADGVELYSAVDESVLNEADYIKTNVSDYTFTDYFHLGWPDHTAESGTISEVIVYAQMKRAQTGTGGTGTHAHFVVPNNTREGAAITLTTSDVLYHEHFATSDGVNAWTWTDIDNMTSGILFATSGDKGNYNQFFCYQMYIEVVYTPAAGGTTTRQIWIF